MKKYVLVFLWIFFASCLIAQSNLSQFHKGIAYYLLEDIKLAKKHFNLYFYNKSNFQLKNGFMLLCDGKYWDATTKIKDYLGINHRSQFALVGIALSTADMKNTANISATGIIDCKGISIMARSVKGR